jgi:tRNA pseudouridine38-40 synthase
VHAQSCGRTDAGEHARVQAVHADLPERTMRLIETESILKGESRFKQALNSLLPHDIRVLMVKRMQDGFHATRDVRRKTYVYLIDPSPVQLPELRRYAWSLRLPLDWAAIEQATRVLKGQHDFKAFCGKGSTAKTTTRTIYEAHWGIHEWHGLVHPVKLHAFRITGNGFLKHMVRSIVGSLIHIGNRKVPADRVARLLESGKRDLVGPTAPPQGLWLWDLTYKPEVAKAMNA